MKSFTFFMHNIYSMGGTVKSISQLANVLAEKGHSVTIISIFRKTNEPYFYLHKNIKIKILIDYRAKPSNLVAMAANRINKYTPLLSPKHLSQYESGIDQFSSYVEKKMIKAIKQVSSDVLVGTRASFNILISKYHNKKVTTVAMEHMDFNAYSPKYQQQIIRAYRDVNKVITLTPADQGNYQSKLKTPVYVIPNIIDNKRIASQKKNIIIAAGRLEYEKGFDLLLESIRLIQDDLRHLNYVLHLYGDGQEKDSLIQFINQYHLQDIVELYPSTPKLDQKLAQSKITVVPSRNEGFGMVLLEAMAQDNIVISFAGNTGPDSIIKKGENGYLVEHDDTSQLAKRIDLTMHNDSELQYIINEGRHTLENYTAEAVYKDFMKMFS
ncbi:MULTISPECIES: glycosyltransferase family 4 protein [Staphylococcus]|uniref:glycosyltransferase family 4 protein n=1 Tax=Staphylococcus TaxID=1279 RepID=UPI0008A4C1B3|nr:MULTISPECIES: glycosyltransferase family 4 protein [Staphylococcus]OFV06709.1 glycoside hydrolase [Staphylococcus sp. HMSC13A10]